MKKTLIILPAYNVEKEIYNLLSNMKNYRENVIIVDDGSTDNTFQIIDSLNYNVIRQEKNAGVASAIKIGINYAINNGYQSAVFMDSDGQHSPKYIDGFLKLLETYDFVVGNRFHINTTAPDIKLGSNLLASIIVKKFSGKKYNDISCGFKAIKLDEDLKVAIEKSDGYSIVFDLFFYALNHNYKIGTIDMEAIYDYSTFLMTRREELLAFISALELHVSNIFLEKLYINDLKDKVLERRDFIYTIDDITFYGFFIKDKAGYIIQGDPLKLRKYLNSES
ncbi:MAG: glycosyltransferase family 2 protein [Lachnospiraceae bacterium]